MDVSGFLILWLIVAIVFTIIEAVTFNVVTIWFSLGAIITMVITALFTVTSFETQVLIFLISSSVLLVAFYPIVKRKFKHLKKESTNADMIIGKEGIVIEQINPILGSGLVKVMGKVWSAKSENESVIEENERVIIKEIIGVKVIVKKIYS